MTKVWNWFYEIKVDCLKIYQDNFKTFCKCSILDNSLFYYTLQSFKFDYLKKLTNLLYLPFSITFARSITNFYLQITHIYKKKIRIVRHRVFTKKVIAMNWFNKTSHE